jgi:hypothetical protein
MTRFVEQVKYSTNLFILKFSMYITMLNNRQKHYINSSAKTLNYFKVVSEKKRSGTTGVHVNAKEVKYMPTFSHQHGGQKHKLNILINLQTIGPAFKYSGTESCT